MKPLLTMHQIHKRFPGVHALKGVDLELFPGEVLALIGENGAGKSTLIKMLGGAHLPTEGEIQLNETPIELTSPEVSQAAGISVIYQEFNLVPHLKAYENIFLGKEKSTCGWINSKAERQKTQELFQKLGSPLSPDTLIANMRTAEQQIVEIAKALSSDVKVLVMDEPSASLTPQEVEGLLKIIKDLKKQGIGMIYISHRLDEIFDIADRVMVMRDGEYVGTKPIQDMSRETMIEMMVGRKIENEFPKHYHPIGKISLEVNNLSSKDIHNISFQVKQGEVLGMTGLIGSGRTETARLIFGADTKHSGTIQIHQRSVQIEKPADAIQHGICLLTEDRKGQGLVLEHDVQDNFGLANLDLFSTSSWMNHKKEKSCLESYVSSLQIKLSHTRQVAKNLSGGNQQKVVLAKWLQRNCDIIIIDEPTRGIDVGAKYEIYNLINELASQGKAILMISSELPEILGMCDRVLVMKNGQISAEVTDMKNATQEQLLNHAID